MDNFKSRGYKGPIDLLDNSSIDELLKRCSSYPEKLLPWLKGRHSMEPVMCDLASHPVIIDELSKILGDDIILWSSQIIEIEPNNILHWHIDEEMSRWPGVTVMIGMKNMYGTPLKLISGSHRIDTSAQVLKTLHYNDDEKVNKEAKNYNPECELINVGIKEGQFIVYNGLIWHAAQNLTSLKSTAIIFQYTTPNHKVFIPHNYQNPNMQYSLLQPDCLLVKGKDNYKHNRIIDKSYAGSWKSLIKTFLVHLPNRMLKRDCFKKINLH